MIAMSGRVIQVMQGEGSSQMLVAVDDTEGAVCFWDMNRISPNLEFRKMPLSNLWHCGWDDKL